MISYQVASFLNNFSFFESFCLFKVGCFTYKECLQAFSFAIIHRCGHKNYPLKHMIRVFKEMLCLFWIFVLIFMLIPTSNSISFGFTYVILFTRADSLIDFTWRVWIFLLEHWRWLFRKYFTDFNLLLLLFSYFVLPLSY